jgi:hypothetical protein
MISGWVIGEAASWLAVVRIYQGEQGYVSLLMLGSLFACTVLAFAVKVNNQDFTRHQFFLLIMGGIAAASLSSWLQTRFEYGYGPEWMVVFRGIPFVFIGLWIFWTVELRRQLIDWRRFRKYLAVVAIVGVVGTFFTANVSVYEDCKSPWRDGKRERCVVPAVQAGALSGSVYGFVVAWIVLAQGSRRAKL